MRSTLDEEAQIALPHSQQDREVTLSSTTLLAIFFGLALICALFFAFGYTLGRRSPADASPLAASTQSGLDSSTLALQASNAQSKPSAAAPTAPIAAPIAAPTDVDPAATDSAGNPATGSVQATPALATPAVTDSFAPTPTTSTSGTSAQPAPAPAFPSSGFTVQIAAVSNPADADVLVSALHKRGYSVSVRRDPADSLTHVQVGPFASRADALAMRQKLLSDGYNAILK